MGRAEGIDRTLGITSWSVQKMKPEQNMKKRRIFDSFQNVELLLRGCTTILGLDLNVRVEVGWAWSCCKSEECHAKFF